MSSFYIEEACILGNLTHIDVITSKRIDFMTEDKQQLFEDYSSRQTLVLDLLRRTYDYGLASLKGAMIINGGTAAALLTLFGAVWSHEFDAVEKGLLVMGTFMLVGGMSSAALGMFAGHDSMYKNSKEFLEIDTKSEITAKKAPSLINDINNKLLNRMESFHKNTYFVIGFSYLLFILGTSLCVYVFLSSL